MSTTMATVLFTSWQTDWSPTLAPHYSRYFDVSSPRWITTLGDIGSEVSLCHDLHKRHTRERTLPSTIRPEC